VIALFSALPSFGSEKMSGGSYFGSSLTRLVDTVPLTAIKDSLPAKVKVDSFSIKFSKDSLSAPMKYEAADSAVVLVKPKKVLLYGKTQTTYQDIILKAPRVELDQQSKTVTAVNKKDSTGAVLESAYFKSGESEMTMDTIRYNFKTQVGQTKRTFSQDGEMLVLGDVAKKVNENTTFIQRARFTTCMLDEPHFAFVTPKMKVITNKLAISGPAHPEFEGVPVPVYVPFGFYPLSQGRHSGMLRPTFITDEVRGIGVLGVGYYKVLSDYWDARITGDIFSYGEWASALSASYRKRYNYSGQFNFNYRSSKLNFKGDPDFSKSKVFQVNWSHSMDSKARPGVTFSANVNAGSTKYNRSVPGNAFLPYNNMMGSSITFAKSWKNKPFNLNISATHSQNNNLGLINVSLPNGSFSVSPIFPFQNENKAGAVKWYEKLSIGYNASFSNNISFYDTVKYGKGGNKSFLKTLIDTAQWSASHNVPIMLSLPPIMGGRINVTPSINYGQTWLQRITDYKWNATSKKVDTITQKGLFIDQHSSMGLNFNTAIFGTFQFKHSRVIALRHVIRPQIGIGFTPDLNKQHIKRVQVDSTGRVLNYNDMGGNFIQFASSRKSGSMNFGIDNNLEMKWRSKKDTGENAIKKIMLIDGFGFSASYDFMRDSINLSNSIPFYLRTTLLNKISIQANLNLNPYQTNDKGFEINKYAWQGGKFSLGRITFGQFTIGTNFQSKPKDPKKDALRKKQIEERLNDPVLQADQQRLLEYMRQNPNEFVDFNIQWQAGFNLSYSFTSILKTDFSGYYKMKAMGVTFNGSFNLTEKWKLSGNGSYDVTNHKMQYMTMSVNRDLHCWQLSINVIPVGYIRSFNFTINPKATLLQDLKINRTRYFNGY
jgi:hypothetical protein